MSKKILITGANGGFGKLSVASLIQQGHEVVATLRNISSKNKEAAEDLKQLGAHVVEIDVTSTESVDSGIKEAIEKVGSLDVVINNAGVGVAGMQEHFTPEDYQRLFDVNVFGVQRINRAVLPHFREKGAGLVLYVSSLLGRVCLPFYGPYNASKWALEAMAENYRAELSTFGIESCIVEPGGFATTFADNLMSPSDQSRNESYGEFMKVPGQMFEGFMQTLENTKEQDPQKVADAIVDLVAAPAGKRPFRTRVDFIGMGDAIAGYNDQLEQITQGLYKNLGMEQMLQPRILQENES